MILYFSGTGNSQYAAKKIAGVTGEALFSLNEAIRAKRFALPLEEERLVIVTPTYAWRIPRAVEAWLRKAPVPACTKVWFVMTCGGEIGNAAKYNKALCAKKEWDYRGTVGVVMPENYIAMFSAPTPEQARPIIAAAEPALITAGEWIKAGKAFPEPHSSLNDKVISGPVNPLFYALCVKDKAFAAGEKCTGCGRCAALCPLGNITLQNGKPLWGGDCTHCMACINHCPVEAIEYGNKSKGKPRYHLD